MKKRPQGKLFGMAALVTGGGGGIGGAICETFAREGASVAVADLHFPAAKRVARRIAKVGGRAIAIEVDVSEPLSAEGAIAAAVEAFGGLDVLVNAAALRPSPKGTVVEQSLDHWRRTFAVNVTGPFLMCKYAIPHLKKSKTASIINVASQLGQRGIAGRAAYGSSKAALIHFTKGLAMDHAVDRIRVNSISPGATLTPNMAENYGTAAEAERRLGPLHMFGKLGKPEDIAAGALFLAAGDCTFINATDLLIDGGYIAFKGMVRTTEERSRG